MFGESDTGESPRTPSPWEALEAFPKSLPKPGNGIPKLVPENEEGNIEYKLQLLRPSPARLARLTTQLKWRLLEGGGQAYYELGVADSGVLIGLTRVDLEESLKTLDEMAGEIGATVVVVKEVEVPNGIVMGGGGAGVSSGSGKVSEKARKYVVRKWASSGESSDGSPSPFDLDPSEVEVEDQDNLFQMDPADQFSIDIDISTVYKPRPTRIPHLRTGALPPRGKKKDKKAKAKWALSSTSAPTLIPSSPAENEAMDKSLSRRIARDKRRGERMKALASPTGTGQAVVNGTMANKEKELVEGLEPPHVDVFTAPSVCPKVEIPLTDITSPPTPSGNGDEPEPPRLIVEALVLRKITLEEAFLDFEFGGLKV